MKLIPTSKDYVQWMGIRDPSASQACNLRSRNLRCCYARNFFDMLDMLLYSNGNFGRKTQTSFIICQARVDVPRALGLPKSRVMFKRSKSIS